MNTIVHATAVAHAGRAVLVRGASGSGKSSLALQLIALGCQLIADDRVALRQESGTVIAGRPDGLPPKIEARGVGLLDVPMSHEAPICLVIDMDQVETERLPTYHHTKIFDVRLKLLRKVDAPHFPAAVLQYLVSNVDSF